MHAAELAVRASGDAVEADDGASQQIEVDPAETWLADVEHDREARTDKITQMVAGGHVYSAEEDSKIQELLAMFATDSSHGGKVRHLKHGATVESSWTKCNENDVLIGGTELVIHGASPLDIIAFLMDVDSRYNRSRLDPNVDVRLEIREVRNAHHSVTFYECKLVPFQNRTFHQALVWKKLSDTQFFWCTYPIADQPTVNLGDKSNSVRAEVVRCIRATYLQEGATRVEYACTEDLKGHFPTWLTNSIVIPNLRTRRTRCKSTSSRSDRSTNALRTTAHRSATCS